MDEAASAELRPEVFQAMLPYLQGTHGNPSSQHAEGRKARAALEGARESIAHHLKVEPHCARFTSGGTESTAWALLGSARAYKRQHGKTGCMAIGSTEHNATTEAGKLLIEDGWLIIDLPVDRDGVLNIDSLDAALAQSPALVSLHWVNSETGVTHDVASIHSCCAERGVALHLDATQGIGILPVPELPELTTLAAHKFGGPKGIGALVIRDHVDLAPLIPGTQEFDSRGGTESVALAVGMAKALELAVAEQAANLERIRPLADQFLSDVLNIPGITLNGSFDQRIPTIINIALPGIRGDTLATALDLAGIACSTGSACSSGASTPSHVLLAMGRSEQEARQAIRLSMSPTIAEAELQRAAKVIRGEIERIRR